MTPKEQKRTCTLLHCTDPKEDFYASIHHQHEPPRPVNYVVLGPLGQAWKPREGEKMKDELVTKVAEEIAYDFNEVLDRVADIQFQITQKDPDFDEIKKGLANARKHGLAGSAWAAALICK